MAIEIKVN